ncbi:MAG: hypothetical protein JWQ96_2839 [Segetibacter sp.]|nr:hypothetical protein [Segetibacter sp.]
MKLQFNKYKKNGTPVYYFIDVVQENGEAKEFCLPSDINPMSSLEWDTANQRFKENQPESKEANRRLAVIDNILMQVFKEQFARYDDKGSGEFEIRRFKYLVKKKEEMFFNTKLPALSS